MSIKRWVLGKVNGTGARSGGKGARQGPSVGGPPAASVDVDDLREPSLRTGSSQHAGKTPLGPYATLIAAIREELEQFVASQLRLHLAIAERDRYLLTSIEVECVDDDE